MVIRKGKPCFQDGCEVTKECRSKDFVMSSYGTNESEIPVAPKYYCFTCKISSTACQDPSILEWPRNSTLVTISRLSSESEAQVEVEFFQCELCIKQDEH